MCVAVFLAVRRLTLKTQDFDILLEPYPLRPGRNFNLHLRGNLKEELPDLQLRTLIVLSRFIRISHTRNLCAEQPGLCPLQPGYQELTITCGSKDWICISVLVLPSGLSFSQALERDALYEKDAEASLKCSLFLLPADAIPPVISGPITVDATVSQDESRQRHCVARAGESLTEVNMQQGEERMNGGR